MSQCLRFPTMWHVRPAKPQISLRICAVWSEPLLVGWVFYDCLATDRTPFGVSKLKRRLQTLVRVYTCQNVKLLEISCHGSYLSTTHMLIWFLARTTLNSRLSSFEETQKHQQPHDSNQATSSLFPRQRIVKLVRTLSTIHDKARIKHKTSTHNDSNNKQWPNNNRTTALERKLMGRLNALYWRRIFTLDSAIGKTHRVKLAWRLHNVYNASANILW